MSLQVKLSRIGRQLMAEKKKFGALVGLFALGLLLWGRLLITNVPRTATAVPTISKTAPTPMPDKFTPEASSDTAERQAVEIEIVEKLTRDPFEVNPALFPKLKSKENTSHLTKSASDPADELQQHQQRIMTEARSLKLQSTILGAQPRAMINGSLIGPGQTIQGFEVTEIRPRTVKLVKDGVTVVLEM